MTTFQQYNFNPWLTPVRLCSSSNIANTYFNGTANNGLGATVTIAASSLTVDSVVANVGDRILLQGQTNANENGVYVVNSIGVTVVLQRAADQQSIEQYKIGQYVSVGAGSALGGSAFVFVEPLPAQLGVSNLSWVDASSSANVTLPTIANHIATYTNTSGHLAEDAATAINGGNIQAGLSGTAGVLSSFPSALASGALFLSAVTNAGGNFNTTISNAASVGQSQVLSVPDGGVAASNFLISNSAGTQTIATGSLALSQGNVTAGSSGHAGFFTSFPGTAANGSFLFKAVNNAGGFASTLSNSNIGQATVYSLPETGAATSVLVSSQSVAATNNVAFTKVITAGQAALAAAGKVSVVAHPSATSQFAILDVKVLKSTGLSGNAGDRLLSLSDGTIVFNNAGITAALLGTPILTVWGGTGNPLAVGASEVSTAGADIFLQYISGANDYNAGSVQLAITLVQVTA